MGHGWKMNLSANMILPLEPFATSAPASPSPALPWCLQNGPSISRYLKTGQRRTNISQRAMVLSKQEIKSILCRPFNALLQSAFKTAKLVIASLSSLTSSFGRHFKKSPAPKITVGEHVVSMYSPSSDISKHFSKQPGKTILSYSWNLRELSYQWSLVLDHLLQYRSHAMERWE